LREAEGLYNGIHSLPLREGAKRDPDRAKPQEKLMVSVFAATHQTLTTRVSVMRRIASGYPNFAISVVAFTNFQVCERPNNLCP